MKFGHTVQWRTPRPLSKVSGTRGRPTQTTAVFFFPFHPHKAGRFNYRVSQGLGVFFGTPCKIIFMFNFNSFYFYFSTYFNSIFSFIFIFLTTTLGHKQALTSPCEGVQLINEVETPGLQGLTADEAKMWFCDLKVSVYKMVLSCLKIFCFQDGSLVFQDGFLVLLFPMVLPNIPGECWWSQWTFFGSTLPGGRHSLLTSSAILFPKSQKWCWSTLAW